MISTPNGTIVPIIFKGSLPYLEHYFPTDKHMKEITREKILISPGEWNPSLLDEASDASEKRLRQLPLTHVEATDIFYNMEGDIIVQKRDVDE